MRRCRTGRITHGRALKAGRRLPSGKRRRRTTRPGGRTGWRIPSGTNPRPATSRRICGAPIRFGRKTKRGPARSMPAPRNGRARPTLRRTGRGRPPRSAVSRTRRSHLPRAGPPAAAGPDNRSAASRRPREPAEATLPTPPTGHSTDGGLDRRGGGAVAGRHLLRTRRLLREGRSRPPGGQRLGRQGRRGARARGSRRSRRIRGCACGRDPGRIRTLARPQEPRRRDRPPAGTRPDVLGPQVRLPRRPDRRRP